MITLGRIQYHAALAIIGTWKGSSLSKISEEQGWKTLIDHHWCRHLFQLYIIHNNSL